ncbi:MAG: AAA family ATPase [Treponema sp.]|nr:AAA family ATPase [Treponema sp.]
MMEEKTIFKKVVNTNGICSCDELDITVEEWKKVLQDKSISNNHKLWLTRFYQENEHKATCKYMGDKYKCHPNAANATIKNFAEITQKILNRFEVQGTDGKPTYWIIPMKKGIEIKDLFEWTMRDELVQAMEELDMTNPKDFEEKNRKLKTWQEIYDESQWIKTDWHNKYLETVNIIRENVKYIHWTEDCIYRLLKSSDNGISRVNRGQLSNEHYEMIKQNWDYYEMAFNKISNERVINHDWYYAIMEKIKDLTGTKYSLIVNRAICGLLPGVMTTAPGIDFFYERIFLIKDVFPEIPEITENWLLDNLNFVSYCKTQVKFKEEYHASGFIFDLYDYCKSLQGDTQMAQEDTLVKKYASLLKNTKNLILTGAPGTGKTFMAKQIAEKMGCTENEICFVQFHPSYDYTDFVEGLRPVQDENGNGSQIGFERKDGVFKAFCEKALKINDEEINDFFFDRQFSVKGDLTDFNVIIKDENIVITNPYYNIVSSKSEFREYLNNTESVDKNGKKIQILVYDYIRNEILKNKKQTFVFIIDEINRGEVAKIFGELFYCIDPGYRGEKGRISTQYQNLVTSGEFQKGFFIPENVYIIGTMNDIDRSVESMDFAFRRRFSWIEVKASDTVDMLDPKYDDNGELIAGLEKDLAEKAKRRMENLNAAIWDEKENKGIEGLNEAYHIGASYFLKLNNYDGNFESLWNYHIKGILQEYLRGSGNEAKIAELKAAYDKTEENNGE